MAGSAVTEKWQYLTDVITAYDGHEQRIQVRQHPRHMVSYDYPAMDSFQAQWLRGLGRMRQNILYYIPMWHTPVTLSEDKDATEEHILRIKPECMLSLRDCEWIEIFVHDDINQQAPNIVRRVREYQDNIIVVKKAIKKKLDMRNTWIYPLKRCSTQPFENLNYIWSNGTNMTHNFEDILQLPLEANIPDKYIAYYEDYPQRNRWNLPEHIGNREVLTIAPQWVEDTSVALSMDKASTRLDNNSGLFIYDMKNMNSYDIHTLQLTLMCKQSINNMIRFFNRVRGRLKSFWAPSWVNDLNIRDDIEKTKNYVYTDFANIADFYKMNTREKKIIIFCKDWTYRILDILTYSFVYDGKGTKIGKVIMKSPIGFDLAVDDILMVSFLNLVRLDSDELQLNYESDAVANCTLILKEVDDLSSNTVPNSDTNDEGWYHKYE